jgi:hypothetical protein
MNDLLNELVYNILVEEDGTVASKKAKDLGLVSKGYGRYGPPDSEETTYKSINKGKELVPVGAADTTKQKSKRGKAPKTAAPAPKKIKAGAPKIPVAAPQPQSAEEIPLPVNMEDEAALTTYVDKLYSLSVEDLKKIVNKEFKKKDGELNEKKIKNTILTYLKNSSIDELDALRKNRSDVNFMSSMISASSRTFGNFVHLRNKKSLEKKLEIGGKITSKALEKLKDKVIRFYSPNQFDFIPMNSFENKKIHLDYFLGKTGSRRFWNKTRSTIGDFVFGREEILNEFRDKEDAMQLIDQIVSQDGPVSNTTLQARRNGMLEILFPSKRTEEFDIENLVRFISANTPMENLKPSQFKKTLDLITGQAFVLASYRDDALETVYSSEPSDSKKRADRLFKKEALQEIYQKLHVYEDELTNIAAEIQAMSSEPSPKEYANFRQRADKAYEQVYSFTGTDARKKALICGKILAITSEAHEFYREIVGGEEAYLPEYGSFPCGDKLAVKRDTDESGVSYVKIERRSVKSSVIDKSTGAQSEFGQYPITEGIYGKNDMGLGSLGWTHKQPFQFPRVYAEEHYDTVIADANAQSLFANSDRVGEFKNLIVALQNAATGQLPDVPHHAYMEPQRKKDGSFFKTDDGKLKYIHKDRDFPGDRSLREYATANDDRTEIYERLQKTNPSALFPENDSFVGYMVETLRNVPEPIRNMVLSSTKLIVTDKNNEVDVPNTMANVMERIIPHYFDTEETKKYFGEDNYKEFMRRGPVYGFASILSAAVLNKHNGFEKEVTHAHYDLLMQDDDNSTLKINKFTGTKDLSNWQIKLDMFQTVDGAWNLSTKYGGFSAGLRITCKKGTPVAEVGEDTEI